MEAVAEVAEEAVAEAVEAAAAVVVDRSWWAKKSEGASRVDLFRHLSGKRYLDKLSGLPF